LTSWTTVSFSRRTAPRTVKRSRFPCYEYISTLDFFRWGGTQSDSSHYKW